MLYARARTSPRLKGVAHHELPLHIHVRHRCFNHQEIPSYSQSRLSRSLPRVRRSDAEELLAMISLATTDYESIHVSS